MLHFWFEKISTFKAPLLITGIRKRSRGSLCRGKYFQVRFTLMLGFMGANPGNLYSHSYAFQAKETMPCISVSSSFFIFFPLTMGEDVSDRFRLSWLFLPAVQRTQETEGEVLLPCAVSLIGISNGTRL